MRMIQTGFHASVGTNTNFLQHKELWLPGILLRYHNPTGYIALSWFMKPVSRATQYGTKH